jgi:hypothetical protein
MRVSRIATWGVAAACMVAGATLVGAGQQGVGQTPSPLPLSQGHS